MINPLHVAGLLAFAGAVACVFSILSRSARIMKGCLQMLEGLKAAVARVVDVTGRLHAMMESHAALDAENATLKARVAELEAAAAEVASVQASAEKAASDLEALLPPAV